MAEINPQIYAVKHKSNKVRKESRSGGVFTALSDEFLGRNGIIYGCILSDSRKAMHVRATSKAERDAMRGSKYIQSSMQNIFKQVKWDLDNNKSVLFSGTSCQVAGLKAYLGNNYKKLLCVDILCHGVSSPKLYREYISWQEKRNKGKVIGFDFRNKKDFGWSEHIETLYMDNGTKINSKIYAKIFYSLNGTRPSCFKCPYKSINHPGDITIADYWGINEVLPDFNDNKGVSLVFINSDYGKKIFDLIKNDIKYVQTRFEPCMMQKPLIEPYQKPETREEFWKMFNAKGFTFILKKYYGYGILNTIKYKIKKILKITFDK